MSEHLSDHLSGLDVDVIRHIDAACRRFEGDWREGRQPSVEDYLVEVPEEGRKAARGELEALRAS